LPRGNWPGVCGTTYSRPCSENEKHRLADDEMVEQPHVYECQGLPDPPGDPLVRLAGVCDAGGVIMGNDHRGGVVQQGLADHFPWMDAGTVNSSAEKLFKSKETVAIVEKQAARLTYWLKI
jgi:hypothetical protein